MTIYVCGFLFDPQLRTVALIRKDRGPRLMKGRLNGVGGKIELGESARGAMVREFREETALHTEPFDWMCFHTERYIWDTNNTVHFMCAMREDVHNVVTAETEAVGLYYCADGRIAEHLRVMYNLRYLIPMAMTWLSNPKDRFFEG